MGKKKIEEVKNPISYLPKVFLNYSRKIQKNPKDHSEIFYLRAIWV